MKRMIVPAVLTESVSDLQAKINLAATFSNRIGVDIIDGEYADNITVMPEDLQNLNWHDLVHEAQLMVVEPIDYLGLLHTAGFERVYGHIERMGNLEEFVDTCKVLKIEPGFGLDLYTPIVSVPKSLLSSLAGILLMSVKAGFSSQSYVDISDEIIELRSRGFEGDIQIDGGMNKNTIPNLIKLGATQFSVTSAIWSTETQALSYRELAALL